MQTLSEINLHMPHFQMYLCLCANCVYPHSVLNVKKRLNERHEEGKEKQQKQDKFYIEMKLKYFIMY